jgi:signal transduction histidine kinase/methanogenic corrinoid protein MtbC1
MRRTPKATASSDTFAGEARYRRYLDALLVGDIAYCRAEVQAWLDAGRGVRTLYEDLIQRALYDLGALWECGRASVADEHLATAISESLLNLSYPHLFDRPSTGCSALVTCAANEHHQIGARMVADIFELHGWRSDFLGANTPQGDVLALMANRRPQVVGLSLTVHRHLEQLLELAGSIRGLFPEVPIIVGGQGLGDAGRARVEAISGVRAIGSLAELEAWIEGGAASPGTTPADAAAPLPAAQLADRVESGTAAVDNTLDDIGSGQSEIPPDRLRLLAVEACVRDQAPVLALTLDSELRVIALNAFAAQLLPPARLGRPLAALLLDFSSRNVDVAALVAAGRGADGSRRRLTLATAAGMPETFTFCFHPLDAGTLALGWPDFAEQRRLRGEVLDLNRELNDLIRQLHQSNAELRELNALRETFLGMALDELRTPIGLIMTHTELVLDATGTTPVSAHHASLRSCLAAAAGMKRRVNDFVAAAATKAGTLRLDRAPASIADIVVATLPLLQRLAQPKGVRLFADTAAAPGELLLDAGRLQQVLVHLAGSAIKNSASGQQVRIEAWIEAELLHVTVHDQGPDIAVAEQLRWFDGVERGATRAGGSARSVSPGLAIARRIIEAHGGWIGVDSAPGRGACFSFSVPARRADAAEEQT